MAKMLIGGELDVPSSQPLEIRPVIMTASCPSIERELQFPSIVPSMFTGPTELRVRSPVAVTTTPEGISIRSYEWDPDSAISLCGFRTESLSGEAGPELLSQATVPKRARGIKERIHNRTISTPLR